jgi:hypothetical protein
VQPHDFSRLIETLAGGWPVAVDNGIYEGGEIEKFARMIDAIRRTLRRDLPSLRRLARHRGLPVRAVADPDRLDPFKQAPLSTAPPVNLLWVVVPDVAGDAAQTFANFQWLAPLMPDLPLAYAVQDGSAEIGVPFEHPNLRCLFLAGSDDYKHSRELEQIAAEGKRRGLLLHGAPCNSARRVKHFAGLGCDTFDGTGASRFPKLIPQYLQWASETCEDGSPGRHASKAGA